MTLKLGPHYLAGGDAATLEWLKLKPAVAKFCWSGYELARMAHAETLTVGRPEEQFIGTPEAPVGQGDPALLAKAFVNRFYAPLIAAYPYIRAWEGPNEVVPDDAAQMEWYAEFLHYFAREIFALGKQAVIGAWPPGAPSLVLWPRYARALQAVREWCAILSRHSYGPLDLWYSYRHRLDNDAFTKMGYPSLPVIITECGADHLGDFPGRWRHVYGSEREYWDEYLRPLAADLARDQYVLGATLFTVGSGYSLGWADFDVGGDLVAAMKEDPMTQAPADDGGISVVSTVVGSNGPRRDKVQEAVYSFHALLAGALADGSEIGQVQWASVPPVSRKWWTADVANMLNAKSMNLVPQPWKCHRSPGMKMYRKPDPAMQPFNVAGPDDHTEMDVWDAEVEAPTGRAWLRVWPRSYVVPAGAQPIWVNADEAEP